MTRLHKNKRRHSRNICLILAVLMIAGASLTALAFTNTAGVEFSINVIDADPPTDTPPALAPGQTWTDKTVSVTDTVNGGFSIKLSALTRGYSVSEPQYTTDHIVYPGYDVVLVVDLSGSITERIAAMQLVITLRDGILAAGNGKNTVAVIAYNSRTALMNIPADAKAADVTGDTIDAWIDLPSTMYFDTFDSIKGNAFQGKDPPNPRAGPYFSNTEFMGTNTQLAVYHAQTLFAAMPADKKNDSSIILLTDGLPTFAYTEVLTENNETDRLEYVIGNGQTAVRALYQLPGSPAAPLGTDLLDVYTMQQIEKAREAVPDFRIVSLDDENTPSGALTGPALFRRSGDYAAYTVDFYQATYKRWELNSFTDFTVGIYNTPVQHKPRIAVPEGFDPATDLSNSLVRTYTTYANFRYGFEIDFADDPVMQSTQVDFYDLSGYYGKSADQSAALIDVYTVPPDEYNSRYLGETVYNYNALTGSLIITDTIGAAFAVNKAAVEARAPAGTTIVYDEATRVLTWTIPAALVPQFPASGNGTGLAPISVTFPLTFDPTDANLVSGVMYYTNSAAGYTYTATQGNPFENGLKTGSLPNNGWMDLAEEFTPPSNPLFLTGSPSPSDTPPPSETPPPSDEIFEPSDPPLPPLPPTGGAPLFLLLGLLGAGLLTAGVVLTVKK